jgi:hypothetical protein
VTDENTPARLDILPLSHRQVISLPIKIIILGSFSVFFLIDRGPNPRPRVPPPAAALTWAMPYPACPDLRCRADADALDLGVSTGAGYTPFEAEYQARPQSAPDAAGPHRFQARCSRTLNLPSAPAGLVQKFIVFSCLFIFWIGSAKLDSVKRIQSIDLRVSKVRKFWLMNGSVLQIHAINFLVYEYVYN